MTAQSPADVWKDFCHQLEQAGTDVLNWEASPMEQAEGLRYLSRLLRISLEMNLENADPAFPYFYQASHETAKIGADNPDNIYLNATISGQHSYRVYGNEVAHRFSALAVKPIAMPLTEPWHPPENLMSRYAC